MIDLRSKDHDAITQFAETTFPVGTELWVYGSRVKGTAYAASDLDLVVKPAEGTKLDLEQLSDFIQTIQDSTIPIIVQVFSWADVPEHFRETIEQRHEVMLVVGIRKLLS